MDNIRNVLLAAESGNTDKIKEYVSSKEISVVDEEGSCPLMYAAANGHEKVVRLLLQNDVNVDQQNHYGWSALLQASCYGHHEVVYTLLQNKADINMCNKWGTTPLVAAAQGGFTTVVKVLLEKGATVTTGDEVPSISPLMAAAQCGNENIIKLLLDHGSNPNTRLMTTGWTALMLAALNNHAPVIKELLRRGAVRQMRDVNNNRAIDLASTLGLSAVVDILSEDLMPVPSSNIDIFEAVKLDKVETLMEIIKKHKVSTTVTDKDGATPLMYAARKGNLKACQILLGDGADVDAQDHIHRWTAFMHAVHHKHYEIAHLLAQHGANVNLRAKNGSSAFDIANLIGDTRTIQLIAQITIQRLAGKEGKSTPLMEEEPDKFPISPPQHLSPQPSSATAAGGDQEEGNDATSILRRVSNAYSASGTQLPNPKDLLRPGSHSPFARQTPSPDLGSADIEEDVVLPAITKPTKNSLSPSPDSVSVTPSPPLLIVPQSQMKVGKKPRSPQPSFANNHQAFSKSRKPLSPSNSSSAGPVKKPNLHLILSPFDNEQSKSSSSKFVPNSRDTHQIKSPRSLPSNTFKFLKSPAMNLQKSGPFLRRDNSSPKFRLPANFSSSSGKTRHPGDNGGGVVRGGAKIQFRPQDMKRTQFKSPSAKIASFEKIKLPSAHKGLDLNTVLRNASLGCYHTTFEAEEIDINSFLTLTESELIEIGITDEVDRNVMISLISQLKEQPPLSPRSPLSPKPFANFKFQ